MNSPDPAVNHISGIEQWALGYIQGVSGCNYYVQVT